MGRAEERDRLERLSQVLRCRMVKDGAGDPCIQGRMYRDVGIENNIHADGQGYSVMLSCTGRRAFKIRLAALAAFCEVRQRGDREAVLHLAELPTPEQAATIRRTLGIRKRPAVSEETRLRLQAQCQTMNQKLAQESVLQEKSRLV